MNETDQAIHDQSCALVYQTGLSQLSYLDDWLQPSAEQSKQRFDKAVARCGPLDVDGCAFGKEHAPSVPGIVLRAMDNKARGQYVDAWNLLALAVHIDRSRYELASCTPAAQGFHRKAETPC